MNWGVLVSFVLWCVCVFSRHPHSVHGAGVPVQPVRLLSHGLQGQASRLPTPQVHVPGATQTCTVCLCLHRQRSPVDLPLGTLHLLRSQRGPDTPLVKCEVSEMREAACLSAPWPAPQRGLTNYYSFIILLFLCFWLWEGNLPINLSPVWQSYDLFSFGDLPLGIFFFFSDLFDLLYQL